MDKNDYTLQFKVWAEPAVAYEKVVSILMNGFPESKKIKENVLQLGGNLLEVWANEFADKGKIDDPEDGPLYYALEVQATPLDEAIDEDHQINIAKRIVLLLRGEGFRAEVGASFEAKLAET